MTRPIILDAVEELGFKIFESGKDYDLNIIGARNPEQEPNVFNDRIHVCYQVGGVWVEEIFECTTDPGSYWLNRPMRQSGTAVLKHPQQMRGAFELGYHKGNIHHRCLRQVKEVDVWRDANKDEVIDYGSMSDSTAWAIQIHRASSKYKSQRIDRYSAGCQVISDPVKYRRFIELCDLQVSTNSWNRFTYTLIEGCFDDA